MVGAGTVLADDPSLTVRDSEGRDPLRIVVDSRLRTPAGAKVLAGGTAIVATTHHAGADAKDRVEQTGAEVWVVDDDGDGRVSLSALMKRLGDRGVISVFCEGGGVLAGSLLRDRLVDKVIFTMASKLLGDGLRAVAGAGIASLDDAVSLKDTEVETLGGDIIVTGSIDNKRG
jgi:diaminohydroxyphosphoribosylaminopyrimidine deaminase/5-amino-6-(5-phosphoribosylamino)uracil reductase